MQIPLVQVAPAYLRALHALYHAAMDQPAPTKRVVVCLRRIEFLKDHDGRERSHADNNRDGA